MKTTIPTPLPTNQTLEGPRIVHEKAKLIVEYDYEGDENATKWAEIIFTEAIFFQFADTSCCEEVLSATEIRRQDGSELLASVIPRWKERFGSQAWQQEKGGSDRFSHFTVFFDDAGAVDVVASACDVRCR